MLKAQFCKLFARHPGQNPVLPLGHRGPSSLPYGVLVANKFVLPKMHTDCFEFSVLNT